MDNKQMSIPPPPPLLLSPPKLSDGNYEFMKKQKHLLMVEGKDDYQSIKDEVENKYKELYEKHDKKYTQQGEANGQGVITNVTMYKQCLRCEKWILQFEMSVHMSCHAAIVKDNLLLGDRYSSRNRKQIIERQKITHVVNCANELENVFEEEGIKYLKLTLNDNMVEEPIEQFCQAAKFIKQSMDEGGRVFVHCMVGKSRSVSSILVYMLVYEGIPIMEGLKKVKEVRPIAQPNMNYMKRLKEFEKQFLQKQ